MKTFVLFGLVLLFIISPPTLSARGRMPPPPRFLGGNIGDWLGEGGNGPIFGFDHPWGIDFPFGDGGIGDPGFTGYLGWEPMDFGGSGGYGGNGGPGCPGECQETSLTGPCIPTCHCRKYTQGAYPETDRICDPRHNPSLSTGVMCYVKWGGCPDEHE